MYNLKQISLAMFGYESTYHSFPPAVIEKDGKPLLSWRVAILPFMEESRLYQQFHLDEPWDSPHNLEVAKTVPFPFPIAGRPQRRQNAGHALSRARVRPLTAARSSGRRTSATACPTRFCASRPERTRPCRGPSRRTCLLIPPTRWRPWERCHRRVSRRLLRRPRDAQLKVDNETLKALITPDGGEAIDPAKVAWRTVR